MGIHGSKPSICYNGFLGLFHSSIVYDTFMVLAAQSVSQNCYDNLQISNVSKEHAKEQNREHSLENLKRGECIRGIQEKYCYDPHSQPPHRHNNPHHMTTMSYEKLCAFRITTSCNGLSPCPVFTDPIRSTTSIPSTTCPKTVCFPFKCGVGAKQIKNWLPFVPGPLFAILNTPLRSCTNELTISSSNLPP